MGRDLNCSSRTEQARELQGCHPHKNAWTAEFNPLNPELNPICYLLALLGAHHFIHVSRIRVK